jgi:hypothetical protein
MHDMRPSNDAMRRTTPRILQIAAFGAVFVSGL